jgi:putative ABC transport system substrate-binding protein
MRRRDFMKVIGSAAAAWPLTARAQQPAMPVIGYLYGGSPDASESLVAAFRNGLAEAGYVEGRNVAIEYRWAGNVLDRLPELAADLVRRQVAVIATPFTSAAARAAKAATATIPIVFSTGADPVRLGLVSSLNQPGGNITGISYMSVEIAAKRFGLLRELMPGAARIAVLLNPGSPITESLTHDAKAVAATLGVQIDILTAGSDSEIDAAFAQLAQARADGLVVGPDTLFANLRQKLVVLAARHAVPAIFPFRDDAVAGGLMSYGASIPEEFRLVGVYTGRILKGARPADLPVIQPTKFDFVVNLSTARALSISIPPRLHALATEVIE